MLYEVYHNGKVIATREPIYTIWDDTDITANIRALKDATFDAMRSVNGYCDVVWDGVKQARVFPVRYNNVHDRKTIIGFIVYNFVDLEFYNKDKKLMNAIPIMQIDAWMAVMEIVIENWA